MARTYRRVSTNGDAPLAAAAYQLAPRSRGVNEHEAKRAIDLQLNAADQASDLAWYFYSRIPELRYIARYVANSLSQARLYVGRVTADPYNPERVESGPAVKLLERFAGGFEGQAELLDRLGLHLTIAGDSRIVGPWDDSGRNLKKPFDQIRVYSTDEIVSRNGLVYYRRPSMRDEPIPGGALAIRIWRPHPRTWEKADSPTISSFTVLREIDLLDQHVHASAVSRLAGAGVVLVPDELSFASDEVDVEGSEVHPFIKDLTEVMSIAIKNRESAAATVPIAVTGPAEALNSFRHITFETPFSDKVPDLRNVSLRRLGLGMDVPPEVLLGMSESTQWSAWQTDESTVRLHTSPLLQLIVNSLTTGWFRPALKKMRNVSEAEADRLTVWYDLSNLQVKPNKIEDAEALYDRFEVAGDTLRITTGFTDSERPTKGELEEQILYHLLRNNPQMATYAINALREKGKVNLPEAFEIGASVGRPPESDIVDSETPGLPGDRSQDRQTQAPPTPSAEGDDSNNEVK